MRIYYVIILSILLLAGCSQKEEAKPPKSSPSDHGGKQVQESNQQPSQNQTSVSVQQLVAQAKTGHAYTVPFAAQHSTISQVKDAWGEPNQVDQVGGGYYANYTKRYAVFGYNQDGTIFDVRSNDPTIQEFTLSDIEKELGTPTSRSTNQNDQIYTYKLNAQYQLKWIIPQSTGKVDHIAVYSPIQTSSPNQNYILSIKGTSENLTASAWKNMIQWRSDILAFPKRYPNDVFVNGPNKKRVALTFDDGPDRINTPKIIEALKQQNVKGTFFFIGQKVQQNPDIVKMAYDNGNVIGSHSFYHRELTKETAEDVRQDLMGASAAIKSVIGKSPALLRPPYGDTDIKVVNVAKEQQNKIILWSIDTLDWSQKEQTHIENNVLENVRNGDIILMHSDDDKTETAKAVPIIIQKLKSQGFEIVDVATLLNTNPYK
ncbi:polysaccharide deacetylase family protein [Neobacillus sp. LXY-1]|uniref:polysaccharide deacetylase family protein n=1 Tax=Neobacillus sp. LXY-1 TaxID=3379133 RepID=UPI003EE3BD4A